MLKAVGINMSGLSGERWPAKKQSQSAETKLSFTHLYLSGLKRPQISVVLPSLNVWRFKYANLWRVNIFLMTTPL